MTIGANRSYHWQLAGLALAMLLPSLGISVANIALPTLSAALGSPFQDIQWVVLSYLLTMTVLVVSAGRLGDLMGRRRLLLIGIGVFTLASAACAMAPSLWMLVAARALQGVGAAIMVSLTTALAGDLVPRDRIGRAMGMLGTMSAVGTALGPSLGGAIIGSVGWQAIFVVLVVLGAATWVACSVAIPAAASAPDDGRRRFDLVGTLLLAGALSAYALAATSGGAPGLANAAWLAAAAVGFVVFGYSQTRVTEPLLQPAALKSSALRSGLLSTVLISTVMMTTLVVGPFYLSGALLLTPVHVGLVMSVGPVLAALAGVPSGYLVDRFGTRRTMLAGLAATAGGCLTIGLMAASLDVAGYIAAIGVVTTGYALFQAANNTAILKDVAADRRGVVSGLMSLARNLGLITGASLMGAVFSVLLGGSGAGEAIAAATGVTFVVAALLAALAIGLAVRKRA